jgi:hypothetical protein
MVVSSSLHIMFASVETPRMFLLVQMFSIASIVASLDFVKLQQLNLQDFFTEVRLWLLPLREGALQHKQY